jgi:hypothetical protein
MSRVRSASAGALAALESEGREVGVGIVAQRKDMRDIAA